MLPLVAATVTLTIDHADELVTRSCETLSLPHSGSCCQKRAHQ